MILYQSLTFRTHKMKLNFENSSIRDKISTSLYKYTSIQHYHHQAITQSDQDRIKKTPYIRENHNCRALHTLIPSEGQHIQLGYIESNIVTKTFTSRYEDTLYSLIAPSSIWSKMDEWSCVLYTNKWVLVLRSYSYTITIQYKCAIKFW